MYLGDTFLNQEIRSLINNAMANSLEVSLSNGQVLCTKRDITLLACGQSAAIIRPKETY